MSDNNWDYSLFWKEALNQIKSIITEQEFIMWFNNIEYQSGSAHEIVVSVPSTFYKDQVSQRYLKLIHKTLSELSGSDIQLAFTIKKRVEQKTPSRQPVTEPYSRPGSNGKENSIPSGVQTEQEKEKKAKHPFLRGEYTFEHFVIGENNSFAANAAMAIAKNPGTGYNPFLLHGGVGLGKTHLVQAIGHLSYLDFDNFKVIYVTAEQFMNEFIEAIGNNKAPQFKNKYRNADMLIIDDIQFMEKKEATQLELFHTFNALYDANKQIIFTSDRPVYELKNLTDRLQNRFTRGLNVDLQPPNFETRCAILQQKVQEKNVPIPNEVIELISENVTSNVRDLEAALTKLIAYSDLLNKEITLEIATQQLRDTFASPIQGNITIDIIQKVVADYFNLSHNDLRGKKRTKAIAFPRQIAMYISREMTEFSTTEVGQEFGGRDHTTVMHACQRVESRLKSDPTMEPTIGQLIRTIKESGTKN